MRTRWLVLLLSVLASKADAQATLSAVYGAPQAAVGHEPRDVELADLNGDGSLDGVVPNTGDGTISVLLGSPSGIFTEHVVLMVPGQPRSVAIADLDGDGLLDIAAGQYGARQISLFLGMGGGDFRPGPIYALSGFPQDIVAANVLGDASPDLLAALSDGAEGVSVLVNDGTGMFSEDGVSLLSGSRFGLAVEDLDGDSDLDVVASGDDAADVLRNTGTGLVVIDSIATGGFSFRVAIGDIDGDGDPDVATAEINGTVTIARNRGGGIFLPSETVLLGRRVISIDIADLTGDGKSEIVAAVQRDIGSIPSSLAIIRENASHRFETEVQDIARIAWSLRVARLNSDARFDVAVTSGRICDSGCTPGKLTSLLNKGMLGFGAYRVSDTGEPPTTLAAGDIDGDRALDVAIAREDGSVSFMRNDGTARFTPFGSLSRVGFELKILLQDVDGDRIADLITAGNVEPVTLRRGRGDGTFGSAETLDGFNRYRDLAIADMDRNGHPDIVTLSQSGFDPGHVQILFNSGLGVFTPSADFVTAGSRSNSMTLADVNGDTYKDAIVAEEFSGGVSVLLNDRSGRLPTASLIVIDTASEPLSIASGDFDHDLDPDVVVADPTLASIHVLRNDGGTLVHAFSQPATDALTQVVVSDLNQDGHLDIAASETFSSGPGPAGEGVRLWLGDGFGEFRPGQAYLAGAESVALVSANLTNDLMPELAVVDTLGSRLWVLLSGAGTLSTEIDFDLDGLSDRIEFELNLDFLDPDSDDDGIFDGLDPSVIAAALEPIPIIFFDKPGLKRSLIAQTRGIETLVANNMLTTAAKKLVQLGSHFDGCLSQKGPDQNDWITDCGAQQKVMSVYEVVLSNVLWLDQ